MQTFIPEVLHSASKDLDEVLIDNMGPFSKVLGDILLGGAASNRKDIKPFNQENAVDLYRGSTLTLDQIHEYKMAKTNEQDIRLIGFISTSLDMNFAVDQAFSTISEQDILNPFLCGQTPVLYKIKWSCSYKHFVMNNFSAF